MLIVVCGSEGIHKKFLTRKIIAATNTFIINQYTVDFNTYPFRILDTKGQTVYQNQSRSSNKFSYSDKIVFDENDMSPDVYGEGIDFLCNTTAGKEIVKQALLIEQQYFLDGIKYYRDVFAHSALDYNLINSDDDFSEDLREKEFFYSDLLETYKNSKLKNVVVCGSFGKTYLKHLAKDIGKENLLVLNIIRNPSVSWCVHQKSDTYYKLHKSSRLNSRAGDIEKFFESTLASISIKDLNFVQTIKFEDIINHGLTVLDHKVTLPVGYECFNNYLTEYEISNVITQNLATEQLITDMNERLSNYKYTDSFEINESDIKRLNLPENINDYFPNNIFLELEYLPLTYKQIIDKR